MKVWIGIWREDDGVLSFEWTLMVTLLTLGIVGGLAAARDAVIDELGDVAEAVINIDQSYSIGFAPDITIGIPPAAAGPSDSSFTDCAAFNDSNRVLNFTGQDPSRDDIPDGA